MIPYDLIAVFDASAIIDLRSRLFPPDVFLSLNKAVEELGASGRICTVDEVFQELERQTDAKKENVPLGARARFAWAKSTFALPRKLLSDQDHERFLDVAQEITVSHHEWSRPGYLTADPYLVALAEVSGCVLVSSELNKSRMDENGELVALQGNKSPRGCHGRYTNDVKIPDMCLLRDVTHHSLLEFFRSQRWQF